MVNANGVRPDRSGGMKLRPTDALPGNDVSPHPGRQFPDVELLLLQSGAALAAMGAYLTWVGILILLSRSGSVDGQTHPVGRRSLKVWRRWFVAIRLWEDEHSCAFLIRAI